MSPTLSHAFLVLKLENLRDVNRYLPAIASATKQTTERLVVILFSDLFNRDSELSHTGSWDEVQALLSTVYVETARVAQEMDRVLMDVDVLLKGFDAEVLIDHQDVWQGIFTVQGGMLPLKLSSLWFFETEMLFAIDAISNYPLPRWASTLSVYTLEAPNTTPPVGQSVDTSLNASPSRPSTYPVVVLGGTFDHLHSGHKILLSMAAWIAHEKMIVGMTGMEASIVNPSPDTR